MNCFDTKQGTITFAVLGLAVVLVGCGGSGKTTLRGTFSDRWDVSNQGGACADQLSGTSITVAVDNVPAGNIPVDDVLLVIALAVFAAGVLVPMALSIYYGSRDPKTWRLALEVQTGAGVGAQHIKGSPYA